MTMESAKDGEGFDASGPPNRANGWRAAVLSQRIRHAPFRLSRSPAVMAAGAQSAAPPALRSPCRAEQAGSAVSADLVSGAESRLRRRAVRASLRDRGRGLGAARDDACDPAL